MCISIGATFVREFRLFSLCSLYYNLDLNVPPISIILLEAVISGTELSWVGVFWNRSSQKPPVPGKDWAQQFQLTVIEKDEVKNEAPLAENTLAPKNYPL